MKGNWPNIVPSGVDFSYRSDKTMSMIVPHGKRTCATCTIIFKVWDNVKCLPIMLVILANGWVVLSA